MIIGLSLFTFERWSLLKTHYLQFYLFPLVPFSESDTSFNFIFLLLYLSHNRRAWLNQRRWLRLAIFLFLVLPRHGYGA